MICLAQSTTLDKVNAVFSVLVGIALLAAIFWVLILPYLKFKFKQLFRRGK